MVKKIYLLIFILLIFKPLQAQKSNTNSPDSLKEELHILKKNLPEFKKILILPDSLNKMIAYAQEHRANLLNMFDVLADSNEQKLITMDSLNKIKKRLQKSLRKVKDNILFKVQIAVYKKHPIDKFAYVSPFFSIDQSQEDLKKYLLGNFRNYQEAKKFSDMLENEGLSCYVVGYRKGKRLKSLSSYMD